MSNEGIPVIIKTNDTYNGKEGTIALDRGKDWDGMYRYRVRLGAGGTTPFTEDEVIFLENEE